MIRTTSWPEPRSKERYTRLKQLMLLTEEMTRIGWRVNRQRAQEHLIAAEARYATYRDKFLQLSGLKPQALGPAGVGATARVRSWFLDDCRAPHVSLDKHTKQPQVNSAALTEWANKYKSEPYSGPAAALYALRKNRKYQAYCKAYLLLSAADGRIHASFFPWGAKTARWSSGTKMWVPELNDTVGMNLQQVPAATPEFDFGDGKGPVKLVESLRDCFIADEGCVIGSADFSALEFRLIAYIFGVRRLIEHLEHGRDIHYQNALIMFSHERTLRAEEHIGRDAKGELQFSPDEKKARKAAKAFGFGLAYQFTDNPQESQWPTILKTLVQTNPNATMGKVRSTALRYFEAYPEILENHRAIKTLIDDKGYREIALSGRRLYYPASMRGYNQGINATFQSTGAELMNRATLAVAEHATWRQSQFYLLAQVHDELVVNVPKGAEAHWAKVVTEAMAVPVNFGAVTASIPATMQFGPCWPK